MPSLTLVPRQTPIAPLNTEALQALSDLQRQQKTTKRLTQHLIQAAQQLEGVAAQLNERGVRHEAEYRKKRRRLGSSNDHEEGGQAEAETEQEKADYEEFQIQVRELTKKLDNGVRAVVDDQVWADGLPETIREIARKAERSAVQAAAAQRQTQQESQRVNGEDDDEEGESLRNTATDDTTAYPPAPAMEETPSSLLKSLLEEQSTTWSSKSLTERYSQHNTYVGFYRMLHDSRDPEGNGPPIPHHTLWFANEEDVTNLVPGGTQQTQRTTRRGAPTTAEDDSSDPEIQIAREKISIKCPITFLPFTQPLTSTKCPHSFDAPAIDSLLSRTQSHLPFTDAQNAELATISDMKARNRRAAQIGVPAIPCPVCSVLLSRGDFRPDPVLKRRVERILAAEEREREEEEEEEDGDGDGDSEDEDAVVGRGVGTQRKPMGLGSSPPPVSGKRKSALEIKRERARSKSRGISVVPATQLGVGDGESEGE